MSLSKKDPSLRVAANEPHLVSLGGGRLSTAVTIHNIPVGDCTIGSCSQCTVTLNGAGVRPIHCTIYRSEENQVTLVPEDDAPILVDNCVIKSEVDLRQGAMITIGDSYHLRYNNPVEALEMRSTMGSELKSAYADDLDYFSESNLNQSSRTCRYYDNLTKTENILGLDAWQCPKVFTADLITVNMPAKDVLGRKYESFSKNLTDNHSKTKKADNNSVIFHDASVKYDLSFNKFEMKEENFSPNSLKSNQVQPCSAKSKKSEVDPLDDMLKICAEYTERQDRSYGGNSSSTSSPIVQNRIITNGSLPRDKRSPFFQELQNSFKDVNITLSPSPKSPVYEYFQLQEDHVSSLVSKKCFGGENLKFVPPNPRTKLTTNCNSPKNDSFLNSDIFNTTFSNSETSSANDELKNFEEKFLKGIESIERSLVSLGYLKKSPAKCSPALAKRINKNVNNLTIDLKTSVSPHSSPTTVKKHPPSSDTKIKDTRMESGSASSLFPNAFYHERCRKDREDLLKRIHILKTELNLLQQHDNETLIGMDIEQAMNIAEMHALTLTKQKLQEEFQLLRKRIYRLDAQRNATRVMEENQQSKLKHSIEMKQDQVEKLKALLKQKSDNNCLKEELSNVRESLENDNKSFEDLEFQYFEGESDWQAYRDDLHLEEQRLNKEIEKCHLSLENAETRTLNSSLTVGVKQRHLSKHLVFLIRELNQCEKQFNLLEKKLLQVSSNSSLSENEEDQNSGVNDFNAQKTQLLFCSNKRVSSKPNNEHFSKNAIGHKHTNQINFLKNELTINYAKNNTHKTDSKSSTCEIHETKIEHPLLIKQKGLHDLDYQRRKIEDLLAKLNSNAKNVGTDAIQKEVRINMEKTGRAYGKFLKRGSDASPSFSCSASSSGASAEATKTDNKCVSPKTCYIDDKRSGNLLLNELSSQGNSSITSFDSKIRQQKQRPLTCYMPIFTADLDLKSHIASAGHPISLCHHVFLNSYSCRGYLNKLGSTFHTWSKRWFVLDRRRNALIYYVNKLERKPRGGSCFSSIDEVYMDHLNTSKSGRPHSTFIIKTEQRTYYLQASSDTAARIWIDAIITGAQGSIVY